MNKRRRYEGHKVSNDCCLWAGEGVSLGLINTESAAVGFTLASTQTAASQNCETNEHTDETATTYTPHVDTQPAAVPPQPLSSTQTH